MLSGGVPRGRIRRTMPLAGFTARAAGGRLIAGLQERAGDDSAVARFHQRTAMGYADLLGHSKGALLKAGQIFSMIDPGELGTGGFKPYQNALSRLQADVPPMPAAVARALVEDEFGPLDASFRDFSDEPIAAASVGQVHHAVLHDGREVAVKIQYPGVAQAIRDDLANTELLATFLRFVIAAAGMPLDIRSLAHEVADRISEEVDYRHESRMIAAFYDLYREHPFIRIPEVIPALSGDRVLTMTYLHGMDWTAAQQGGQELKNAWAEVIVRFTNINYRNANLAHADPHPGNYRFNSDGTVGFLDFGCVNVLRERPRRLWVQFIRAAIDGQRENYRPLLTELGFLTPESIITDDELDTYVADMAYECTEPQPFTYSPATTARVIGGFFDIRSKDHPATKIALPTEHAFTSRIMLACSSICAGLHATVPVKSIMDDLDGVAEPCTDLGKAHHAWVRKRGLPGAVDHHDHI